MKKILNNPLYLGLAVVGLLLLVIMISLIFKGKNKSGIPIKQGQIQIVKGDEVITINENGLVEYKSKDRSYSEMWDSSQINSFFSMMERKARDYLSRSVSGGDCGYRVFMFLEGKLVTVCIDSSDSDMADTVDPVFIRYSDISLSDYFEENTDDGENEDDEEFDGVINFPTSTPRIIRVTPTPTTFSAFNINTNYAPVKADCETWSGDIVRNRAIISNTFCTVDATPVPVP